MVKAYCDNTETILDPISMGYLKRIELNTRKTKQMKKSDLKTGMRAEVIDCEHSTNIIIKINNDLYGVMKNGNYHPIYNYNDDLTNGCGYKELDLVKVYDIPSNPSYIFDHSEKGDLLWERKEEIKIDITIKVGDKILRPEDFSEETWAKLRK